MEARIFSSGTRPLIAKHPFAKDRTKPSIEIRYELRSFEARQRRLANRLVLAPDVDLGNYRVHACVDWVDVAVDVGRRTNFYRVQRIIERFSKRTPRVFEETLGKGRVSNRFKVRIQEPDLRRMAGLRAAIAETYPMVSDITVVGLEVSVDVYPKDGDEHARMEMTALLMKHLSPREDIVRVEGGAPRSTWGRSRRETRHLLGKVDVESDQRSSLFDILIRGRELPPVDATLYYGTKSGGALVNRAGSAGGSNS